MGSPSGGNGRDALPLPPSPGAPEEPCSSAPLLRWCAVPAGALAGLVAGVLRVLLAAAASGSRPIPFTWAVAQQSILGGALLALGLVLADRVPVPASRALRWFAAAFALRAAMRVTPTILLLARGLGPFISAFGLWPHIALMVVANAVLAGLLAALVVRFAGRPEGLGWRCAAAGLALGMSRPLLDRLAALALIPGALGSGHGAALWAGIGWEMLQEGMQHATMALAVALCIRAVARRSQREAEQ